MNNTYSDEMTESIRRALVADNRFEFRREGDFLRQGICPNCGKKTCYIKLSDPYRVSCDRLNKCGWSASTRDLYRDLFESLSRRIRPTKENPNATADAYMRDIRGFNLDKIRGMYRQGAIYIEATGQYFPAVEVSIGPDVVWKRIIDAEGVKANDGKKAKIHGSYKDTGWIPPGMTFDKGDTIWITEGIFKSMAFLHIGKKGHFGPLRDQPAAQHHQGQCGQADPLDHRPGCRPGRRSKQPEIPCRTRRIERDCFCCIPRARRWRLG